MSVKDRLRRQERRISGGVRLTPTGAPVIQTESGLQFNGYFVESLKCLDPGKYQLLFGPEVPFNDFWDWTDDEGLTWPAIVQRMVDNGAEYQPA